MEVPDPRLVYILHRQTTQQIAQRATCKFNANFGQNIPPLSFHTRDTRIETA